MTTSPFDASVPGRLDAPWVRRLAAALLEDPSAADDVLQEAWLRLGGEPYRPGYLAAVVRSLVRSRRRADRRRAWRERAAARPEALPSTAQVAERAEVTRRLAQAVEALEEPYRTTVVLRYYDGLSSAEIARRTGTPDGTVRARLKRGVERLRARLDDGPGGRASWSLALASLARAPLTRPEGGVTDPLPGPLSAVLAVKAGLWLALAGAGLVLGWAVQSRATARSGPGAGSPGESLAADLEVEPGTEAGPALSISRDREAAGAGRSPAAQARTEVAERDRVLARAIDSAGAPIAQGWLRLRHLADTEARETAAGRLALEVETGELERLAARSGVRTLEVELGARGHATRLLRPYLPDGASVLELGDVVLREGGAVIGRVVDADGFGVEGALVAADAPMLVGPGSDGSGKSMWGPPGLQPESWQDPAVTGLSGPGGAFRVEGIPAGHVTVWARTDASLWTRSEPVGLRKGEEVAGIELVVHEEPQRVIAGRVLDPQGRAVVGAELVFTGGGTTLTDARGSFHFVPTEGGAQNLRVRSPSTQWEDTRRQAVEPGTLNLIVRLEPARWLVVEALDPAARPVRAERVFRLPATGPTEVALGTEGEFDEQGRARLRLSDEPIRIRVEAPGYRDLLAGPFDPDSLPDPLVVTLEPVPALVGRVLRPDGGPAAGARVSLHRGAGEGGGVVSFGGAGPDPRHLTHQSWTGDREAFVYALSVRPVAATTADEDGRFRLPLPGVDTTAVGHVNDPSPHFAGGLLLRDRASGSPPEATWYVHAALEDEATLTDGPHRFDPASHPGEDVQLELRLPRGGSLAGRLVLEPLRSPVGWTMRASDGLAELAPAPVAADGSFRFDYLHPGGWQVRAFEPGRTPWTGNMLTSRVPEPDVEIASGETAFHEHVSGPRACAVLRGRLWVDGGPPGPWVVIASQSTRHGEIKNHELTVDPDGLFELALEPGLETTLTFRLSTSCGTLWLQEKPVIVAGDNAWSLDLATARLEARYEVIPAQLPGKTATYESMVGSVTVRAQGCADEPGSFGPLAVPAGRGVLRAPQQRWFEPGQVLAELDLHPGEERALDLR